MSLSFRLGHRTSRIDTRGTGKLSVLNCDMTEAELQKRFIERRFKVSKSNFESFTFLETNNFQQVLKDVIFVN